MNTQVDISLLDIITEGYTKAAAQQHGWYIVQAHPVHSWWITVSNDRSTRCEQGWKLHISAGISSAAVILGRVIDVLLAYNAPFKVAASLARLQELNNGSYELSQIGKFITVYPNDDHQALCLASALHEATRGLRGPAIPSDRQFAPGSVVYYRYGSFIKRYMQTVTGTILLAITTPEGELVPDRRSSFYLPPPWAVNPFKATHEVPKPKQFNGLLNNRYLIIKMLHRAPGGAVARTLDVVSLRRCVIKRASHDAYMRVDGSDARDGLRHEAAILAHLAPDPHFPSVFELFEYDDDLFLVMEDILGKTLDQHIRKVAQQGHHFAIPQVLDWARELVAVLNLLHTKGIVYCDLKLSNIIVTPEKRLRLIDFDLCYKQASGAAVYGNTTRGYASPQQVAGEYPAISDDVYSFGALLYSLLTGVDPSLAPRALTLLDRPLVLLNPEVDLALEQLITRCLDPNPAARYPSMSALDDALSDISMQSAVIRHLDHAASEDRTGRYHTFAHRLGETLCSTLQRETSDEAGLDPDTDTNYRSRDIYDGRAGSLLALAELTLVFDNSRYRIALALQAKRLQESGPLTHLPLPGLYIGESGIAAALLRAGQVLQSSELVAQASERGHWIATLPYASPDLLLGTAGRLRFHLLLWRATAERAQLQFAVEAGEALLVMAEDVGVGAIRWPMPAGYDHLSGRAHCGFAHGAAGIADALLDLFEVCGDTRFLAVAQSAGRWLTRLATPALNDGSGFVWPTHEGGVAAGAGWFQGAAGIGHFFRHAATLGVMPDALELAVRAARTTGRGGRWADPSQAHGLAGMIEFLLDMFQMTSDRSYRDEAYDLALLLEAWIEERDGALVCLSEASDTSSPGYMTGYAGIALCLLRLGDPEHQPHLLCQGSLNHQPALKVIASRVD